MKLMRIGKILKRMWKSRRTKYTNSCPSSAPAPGRNQRYFNSSHRCGRTERREQRAESTEQRADFTLGPALCHPWIPCDGPGIGVRRTEQYMTWIFGNYLSFQFSKRNVTDNDIPSFRQQPVLGAITPASTAPLARPAALLGQLFVCSLVLFLESSPQSNNCC